VGGVPASSDVRPDGAIEIIVPWDAPAGEAVVLVRANGFPSNPFTLVFEGGGRHWLPLILKQAGAPGPASPTTHPHRHGSYAERDPNEQQNAHPDDLPQRDAHLDADHYADPDTHRNPVGDAHPHTHCDHDSGGLHLARRLQLGDAGLARGLYARRSDPFGA